MAFTRDYDITIPAGTEDISQGDDRIRDYKADIAQRLESMLYGFDTDDGTGDEATPGVKALNFKEQDSISTPAADQITLAAKEAGGKAELYVKDEDGDEFQITTGGKIGGSDIELTAGKDLTGSSTSDININSKFTVAGASGNTGVGGTLTVTGESTFNSHINLGAGDDLVGSPTSDIKMNTNKFTVDGASGNTLVGGTLDIVGGLDPTSFITSRGGFIDEDSMATNSATKVCSQQSIKAYADTQDASHSTTDQAYADSQDDSHSTADRSYADTQDDSHSVTDQAYANTQDDSHSTADQAYANTQDDSHSTADRSYADGEDASHSTTDQAYADSQDASHSTADRTYTDTQRDTRIAKNGSTAFTGTGNGFKDEDNMASNSAVAAASQQSIKAYIDDRTKVNIQQATKTDTQTITASVNTFTAIAGLSVSITPSSTSSKILVYAVITGTGSSDDPLKFQLFRNSTAIQKGTPSGNRIGVTTNLWEGSTGRGQQNAFISFLDSPNSVSAVIYSVKASSRSNAFIGRSVNDSDDNFFNRSTCNIIVQEILQ